MHRQKYIYQNNLLENIKHGVLGRSMRTKIQWHEYNYDNDNDSSDNDGYIWRMADLLKGTVLRYFVLSILDSEMEIVVSDVQIHTNNSTLLFLSFSF